MERKWNLPKFTINITAYPDYLENIHETLFFNETNLVLMVLNWSKRILY
jgi:hypothetical protein